MVKANPDKSHLLLSSKQKKLYALINNYKITNSEILLGITFDNELNFNEHVSNLCIKATNKLHALARISHYMSTNQKRVIMKAFIQSQFRYFVFPVASKETLKKGDKTKMICNFQILAQSIPLKIVKYACKILKR